MIKHLARLAVATGVLLVPTAGVAHAADYPPTTAATSTTTTTEPQTTTTNPLPFTGGDSSSSIEWGIGALVVGSLALAAARNRRTA